MCAIRQYFISLMFLLLFNITPVSASEVIELTQTSCQFIEAENGVDHRYNKQSADDCEQLNDETAVQRLGKAKALHLKAGDYVFRVTNRDVAYTLGFWLRGTGLSRFTLPGVSGGGIGVGQTQDYAIALEAGEYRYSCPLNPTPDYILIVE